MHQIDDAGTLKNSKPAMTKEPQKLLSIIIANTLSELEEKYAYLVERLMLKRSQSAYAYAYAN